MFIGIGDKDYMPTTKNKKAKSTKSKNADNKILVVVESPSKGKVIGKYLGSKYIVLASVGHVRDLPKSRLAVDVEKRFEPEYINIRGKGDVIKELKKAAEKAKKVYLATDPDREGEAIAWHLSYILGLSEDDKCRVTFNEINKEAVKEAMKNPREIDMGLVSAQQARRILDRLVGYQISPLLWNKVRRGLSAGRVQSAALKIICDRENEILEFKPKEYWNINAEFKEGFTASLFKIGKEKAEISDEKQANIIEENLKNNEYVVESVKKGTRKSNPYPPFTTSTLQQDAAIKLGFQTKKTMQIAQQLYEGINIKGIGTRGIITYMRTDSVRVSNLARANAKEYIIKKFGDKYSANNIFSNKKKDIQDAHEAIRPSDINLNPDEIKESLSPDQHKLYNLIWSRFLASQMANAKYDTTSLIINNDKYKFKATGSRLTFDGFKKVYNTKDSNEDMKIPEVRENQKLKLKKLNKIQKFTQPPARYTEASLVKELEDRNIGRPSTYAAIISTIIARTYIKREKKSLIPTKLGFDVTKIMSDYFSDIVNVEFTAAMEDKLDDIEIEKLNWREVIAGFYEDFSKELEIANKEIEATPKEIILSDEICEKCGKPMAYKEGRFGKFLACTGYPDCKNTKPIVKRIGISCPSCGKDIIEKRGRKTGKIFYGCIGYPDCTVSFWDKPIDKKCPKCGNLLVKTNGKKKQIKCSSKECDYKE